jgi:hypothetical protein
MTEIYQTVDTLDAPISDDIRSVLDRMFRPPPGHPPGAHR